MTDTMKVIIGVLLPFLGTSLGAASVFFMKGEMNPKLQKALLGFASGVMVAASVWSLIMPGIEMAEAASYGEIKAWFLSQYSEFKEYRNNVNKILKKVA